MGTRTRPNPTPRCVDCNTICTHGSLKVPNVGALCPTHFKERYMPENALIASTNLDAINSPRTLILSAMRLGQPNHSLVPVSGAAEPVSALR